MDEQNQQNLIPADFDVVDSAIWAYFQRLEHYPAAFARQVYTEGAFTQYVIFPDATQDMSRGQLGRLEVRKSAEGTLLTWHEPDIHQRDQTTEEQRAIRKAFQAAVKRHKGPEFDFDDIAQREALDTAVDEDLDYRMAMARVDAAGDADWLDTYAAYSEQQQVIAAELMGWLKSQGIVSADGGVATADESGERKQHEDPKPYGWEHVPQQHWWIVIEWQKGLTAQEIARDSSRSGKTIYNRLSELRTKLTAELGKEEALRILPKRKSG